MMSHIYFVFIFIIFTQFSFSQNSNRVITTGVPFLLITSDARAAGMGELGQQLLQIFIHNNGIQLNMPFHQMKKDLV